MLLQHGFCDSIKLKFVESVFKKEYEYKIALFKHDSNITKSLLSYNDSTNESVGNGYSSGGRILEELDIIQDKENNKIYVSFNNVVWRNSSISASKALIYNNSLENKPSIILIDFEKEYTSNNDTFQINFKDPISGIPLIGVI